MPYYHIAQICLNGHKITTAADDSPELKENFCSKCGAATITNCPDCNTSIRGYYEVEGVFSLGNKYKVPSYCHNCGKPYPWTKTALESAKSLIDEDENLNSDEKKQFFDTLPDLIVESPTPKTQLAAARFKRFISKAATYTADGVKDIIVNIASETIKKSLGL
ncbi:DUF2321 domain-containing protein [Clostridium hydrogenum]|uniref:DUF2321 domain-containing protein n=1 Tax=Clostridium hydrogenum TaxID=2855764 RepID=UPI001F2EE984|nr:DUF2321 domain-containing protein [Clostridium hydrogenum]